MQKIQRSPQLAQRNTMMNERIEQLIEECTEYWTEKGDTYFDKEKFAELIVRECADVIAPMGDWCGGHGEPSMPSTRACAKRIKEHFGVK